MSEFSTGCIVYEVRNMSVSFYAHLSRFARTTGGPTGLKVADKQAFWDLERALEMGPVSKELEGFMYPEDPGWGKLIVGALSGNELYRGYLAALSGVENWATKSQKFTVADLSPAFVGYLDSQRIFYPTDFSEGYLSMLKAKGLYRGQTRTGVRGFMLDDPQYLETLVIGKAGQFTRVPGNPGSIAVGQRASYASAAAGGSVPKREFVLKPLWGGVGE